MAQEQERDAFPILPQISFEILGKSLTCVILNFTAIGYNSLPYMHIPICPWKWTITFICLALYTHIYHSHNTVANKQALKFPSIIFFSVKCGEAPYTFIAVLSY